MLFIFKRFSCYICVYRFTVFASDTLPVTICPLDSAENVYKELLGTELFRVPVGNQDRLEKWPQLVAGNDIKVTGVDWESSCADILLSSAGLCII